MKEVVIIGCGFVADLYMRSLMTFPDIRVVGAFDLNAERSEAFCVHWKLHRFSTIAEALAAPSPTRIVLNLTNPSSHFEVSRRSLEAGFHVYTEKPLAIRMDQAEELHKLARERGLMLASAPCSILGEAAQTLAAALRRNIAGTPRLIYAELDDDFIPQAPYRSWKSESGAPWPYEDEFRVGCTLEHAGYYLAWLVGIFGTIHTVIAVSAVILPDKLRGGCDTPDYSSCTLLFEAGVVARLTCSIIAPHDHRIRIICDQGVLEVAAAWNNDAPVHFRRRLTLRRRLVNQPFRKRIKLPGPTHPKVGRMGSARMNFALGPAEMLEAIVQKRPCRLSPDLALHVNEVTLAIQNAGTKTGPQTMRTRCAPIEPMAWAT